MFLHHGPIHLLIKRSKLIIAVGFVFAVVFLLVSFLFPLEYKANSQVLIISRSRTGVDPYTVIKSAERVGENIAQVMKTGDFFDKVFAEPENGVDKNYFDKLEERKKRRLWQKSVEASVVYGTGVLDINIFHPKQDQALALAKAVGNTLVSRGWEYVGADVSIRVVNQPIATNWPVRPNLVLNSILGFLTGALIMSLMVGRKYWV